jgi:hypothetical protein
MKAPRAAPPPRRSRHPIARGGRATDPNPSPAQASLPRPSRACPRGRHPPCGRYGCVPRDPRRSRCGVPLRAPTRRPADDPSLAGRSRPRSGAGARAWRSVDAVPVDLAWPGPSREPDDRRIGKESPCPAGFDPGFGPESSGRPASLARPRAQALSGRAPASGSRRQLNAGCGCRRKGGCRSSLSRLPRQRVSKHAPMRQSQSPARPQNLVDGSRLCAQTVQPSSTDRSTGRNVDSHSGTAIDAWGNPV